jgi:glycosyltransferase involved in cell wall biosynthesis
MEGVMSLKKVIFLITFSPKYDEYADKPKPAFNWTTPDGNWVGIWGYDWGDLLLKSLIDYYPDYTCEVWQPDLRADRIYMAQLHERFVHRNFPAIMIKKHKLGRKVEEVYSKAITDAFRENDESDATFLIPTTDYSQWLYDCKTSVKKAKILYFSFINSGKILPCHIETLNPLKYIVRHLQNQQKIQWLKQIKNLLISNDNPSALEYIKTKYPDINTFYFHFGLDLSFWKPVVSQVEARKALNIQANQFVFVLSNRLVQEYQIDKFIEAIARVKTTKEFSCYITGHGLKEYEEYLNQLVQKYKLDDRIHFVGYVSDEILRSYLIAADVFAVVAKMFAGSNGAVKAMAVGTPILHVTMGFSYEFLKANQTGAYVQPDNYDEWVEKITEIIDGKPIAIPSREEIEDHFSWKRTAQYLHDALINSVL